MYRRDLAARMVLLVNFVSGILLVIAWAFLMTYISDNWMSEADSSTEEFVGGVVFVVFLVIYCILVIFLHYKVSRGKGYGIFHKDHVEIRLIRITHKIRYDEIHNVGYKDTPHTSCFLLLLVY